MPPVEPQNEIEEDPEAPGEPGVAEITYTVEPNYAGWRLDKYLCQKIRRASRTRVQEIIANDLVFARRLKPSTTVWPGLTFTLRRALRAEPSVPPPEAMRQVFLDDWLLVVDKPAGLPMHPTARYHQGTLVSQLKVLYGPAARADPAHRLDRETSGLVVCGRTLGASQRLTRAFALGEVAKEYLAIVEGHPPEEVFEVDAPIAEGTKLVRIAVRVDAQAGRPAQTSFDVLSRFWRASEPFALVRCRPRTGRQHQIRVHAKLIGFPLVGDKIYGPDPAYFDRFSRGALEPEAWLRLRLPRQALHAARVTLRHPELRHSVTFEAPLPEDLRTFVEGPVGSTSPGGPRSHSSSSE